MPLIAIVLTYLSLITLYSAILIFFFLKRIGSIEIAQFMRKIILNIKLHMYLFDSISIQTYIS